jgi:hypothetical protein
MPEGQYCTLPSAISYGSKSYERKKLMKTSRETGCRF